MHIGGTGTVSYVSVLLCLLFPLNKERANAVDCNLRNCFLRINSICAEYKSAMVKFVERQPLKLVPWVQIPSASLMLKLIVILACDDNVTKTELSIELGKKILCKHSMIHKGYTVNQPKS